MTDPVTKKPTRRRKENKGRQPTSRLTINGRIKLQRRWWHASQDGSECPADSLLGAAGPTPGVVEMACRENEHASSFAAAAENQAIVPRRGFGEASPVPECRAPHTWRLYSPGRFWHAKAAIRTPRLFAARVWSDTSWPQGRCR